MREASVDFSGFASICNSNFRTKSSTLEYLRIDNISAHVYWTILLFHIHPLWRQRFIFIQKNATEYDSH